MFAVTEIQGHQYLVQEGDLIQTEKMQLKKGDTYACDKILLVDQDGKVEIGTPYLSQFTVQFEVIRDLQGDKIRVYKMKAKKRYRRTIGHRQDYTELKVVKIGKTETKNVQEEEKPMVKKVSAKTDVQTEKTPKVSAKKVTATRKTSVKKVSTETTPKKAVKKSAKKQVEAE